MSEEKPTAGEQADQDPVQAEAPAGPAPDPAFRVRLREVVRLYGSTSALARAIGRSEGAIRKWLRGESEPCVTDLRAICERSGTAVDWLVTGRGQREAPLFVRDADSYPLSPRPARELNYALLEEIMDFVDSELQAAQLELPSVKRSTLIVTAYELCRDRKAVDTEAVSRLVKLAA
jgi:transcriptional regulator with XRE-family HTH domain